MASSRLRAPASSRWQLPELVVGATTTPMSGKQILRRPAEIMHTDTAPGQCVRLAARLDNGFGEVCKSFACARVASVRDHLSVLESSGDDLDSSKAHCCQSVRRGAELSCAPIKRERERAKVDWIVGAKFCTSDANHTIRASEHLRAVDFGAFVDLSASP